MDGDRIPDPVRVMAGFLTLLGDGARLAAGATLGVASRLPGIGAGLAALDARGAEALHAADAVAERVLRAVVRRVVAAALAEVDITAVVRDHVDLDTIAEGIDVERIVDRVDVNAIAALVDIAPILDRVDVNEVAARVELDPIIDRVDIARILDRVDVDAVAAKVDIDGVIDRIDLVGLAGEVIDGVDLPRIIRDSTSTMSTEAVHGVRTQGMAADDAVAGFVGRLFRREGDA